MEEALFSVQFQTKRSAVGLGGLTLKDVFVCWQVIQFGVDCSEDECTCRDPDAEENKNKVKHLDKGGGGGGGMQ